MRSFLPKFYSILVSLALLFGIVAPAKAFYLYVPDVLKFWSGAPAAQAQYGGMMGPAPMSPPPGGTSGGTSGDFGGQQQQYQQQGTQQYSGDQQGTQQYQQQGTQQYQQQGTQQYSGDQQKQFDGTQQQQYSGQQGQFDGSQQQQYQQQGTQQYSGDQQKQFDGTQQQQYSGQQGQFDGQKGQYGAPGSEQGQYSGQQGQYGGEHSQQGQQGEGGQQGPSEEQQKQEMARRMKDMMRGIKDMERGLKQFERMIAQAEKNGTAVPQEVKDKLTQAFTIVAALKSAKTDEEISAAMESMSDLQEIMQYLDEARREIFEKAQRLQEMKRAIKGMEQGLRMFKKMITQLTKQKIAVPAEVAENVGKIEALITAIKNAKSFDEVESLGLDDMPEIFMALDQSRQQLEVLARWPQTLKQLNREISNLDRMLKRAKTLASKLAKQGMDLSGNVANFEAAIAKIKAVRDEASSKVASGNAQEAFELLENDFFGQLEDVFEFNRVIETVANLGRFTSDFKRGLAEAQRTIRNLDRKKVDTSELKELFARAKAKGNEIGELLKTKPVDEESIIATLQELEDIRQEFEQKADELGGVEEARPWEKGPQQLKEFSVPSSFNKLFQEQKPEGPSATPPQAGETTPVQ